MAKMMRPIRTNGVVAATFAIGVAVALFAASGGAAVGAYSFGRHTTTAFAKALNPVSTTDGYTVTQGPTVSTDNKSPALSATGTASTGKVAFTARTVTANANFNGSHATSAVENFNLLAGKVTFDRVTAVANSPISGTTITSNVNGSGITNLRINGVAISAPANKTFPFKNGSTRIGHVDVLKRTKTHAWGTTSIVVIGVKVVFEVAFNGFKAGQIIEVAKSKTTALCCGMAP